ncbi:MAG TPA: ferrous iron transport protein B [Anaerolineae bacterium]|nr:ferrous iron transport protein B [Anaerolineae bacterium]
MQRPAEVISGAHRGEGTAPGAARAITVALAGAPNVGKSSVFNPLTGLSQHVGNWPGKTVEQKAGACQRRGRTFEIVDLPGAYSLTANSPEEQVTREYILLHRPDVVAVIVNAANLERTLYLVAELLELPVPIVVGVNMMDVAESNGVQVEVDVLQAALGVPVVGMVASRNEGPGELLDAVARVADGAASYAPQRPELGVALEALIGRVEALIGDAAPAPYPRRWLTQKLLEGDREVAELLRGRLRASRWAALDAVLRQNEDAVLAIASARYAWIGRMARAATRRPRVGAISLTERVDRVATHPIAGPLVLLGLLGLTFWTVYRLSEPLVALLQAALGLAGDWTRGALAGTPWLGGLLADGVLGGVGTVLSVLPMLALFFAVIAILEDVGYLARGAFVADRFMHRLGLHGKSFLPLFLGFGCNVPAVLGTRILESKRDRLLTTLLVPLVPCTGRLAVLVFMTGALFGSRGPLVTLGLLALSLAVIGLSGALLNRLLFGGESSSFIMELPLYHLPNWRTILLHTWQHLVAFVERAGTTILLLSLTIWALATLPGGGIEHSYLAALGRWLAPLGGLMGLEWRPMVALLASIVAKEQSIATLAVLTAGTEGSLATALPALLTPAAGLAFLVVQILFVPCVATITAVRQETGSWRWTAFSIGFQAVIAFGLGILVYQAARLLGLG